MQNKRNLIVHTYINSNIRKYIENMNTGVIYSFIVTGPVMISISSLRL